jgi:putative polyketide hydroxylase
VHNLAWKLASVIKGDATPALLDTYQPERRPLAVLAGEQARLRTDFMARYGVRTPENASSLKRQLDGGAVMTRYRYTSSAVVPDQASGGWVSHLAGQPGTRLPHVWLDASGQRVSTLDLCGPGFALLVTKDASSWRSAAESMRDRTGQEVAVHEIGPDSALADPEGNWPEQVGLPAGGAILVRPDQHVAARSDRGLSPAILLPVLRSLQGHPPASTAVAKI